MVHSGRGGWDWALRLVFALGVAQWPCEESKVRKNGASGGGFWSGLILVVLSLFGLHLL